MSKRHSGVSGYAGRGHLPNFARRLGHPAARRVCVPMMMHAWKPLWLLHSAAFAAAVLSAVAAPPPALAASAVGHVSVTILAPAAGVSGGAMSFDPAGSASGLASGGVTVTGVPGTPVTLSLSAGNVARGPGMPIPFRVAAASPVAASAIDRSGVLRLALGATLSVGRQQAPGAYRGDYTVTVDY